MTYVEKLMEQARIEIPDCPDDLLRLYCLLVLTLGVDTSRQDVHDAWALWSMDTEPDHPAIVPFDELTPDVQDLDEPYTDAIHRLSERTYLGRLG